MTIANSISVFRRLPPLQLRGAGRRVTADGKLNMVTMTLLTPKHRCCPVVDKVSSIMF